MARFDVKQIVIYDKKTSEIKAVFDVGIPIELKKEQASKYLDAMIFETCKNLEVKGVAASVPLDMLLSPGQKLTDIFDPETMPEPV